MTLPLLTCSADKDGFMKEILFFPFVLTLSGLLVGLARGVDFGSASLLASLPIQESAALFIFGSALIASAGYGKRKHQEALARQSKEDRLC